MQWWAIGALIYGLGVLLLTWFMNGRERQGGE
jgi:hypothetical protein